MEEQCSLWRKRRKKRIAESVSDKQHEHEISRSVTREKIKLRSTSEWLEACRRASYRRRSTLRNTTASRLKYLLRRSCWEIALVRCEWEDVEVDLCLVVSGGVASPFDEVTLSMELFGSCRRIFLMGRASGKGETSSSISISRSVSLAVSPSFTAGVTRSSSACGTGPSDNWGSLPLTLCFATIGVRFAIALRCPYRRSMSARNLRDRTWIKGRVNVRGFSKNTRKANCAAWAAKLTKSTA